MNTGLAQATTASPGPAGQKPNVTTLATLLQTAADLGSEAGKGRDVQIKFDLKVLEGAFQGAIDLSANKHGDGIDDATKLAEAYVRAQGSATIFDTKASSVRKLVSNVRTCVKLGMWPKGGPGEPLQTVNSMITLRQKLRQDPQNSKKLDDAHNTLMRFARAQLKRDQVIPDNELRSFCFKPDKDARTAEDIWEGVRKLMQKLENGKIPNCPDLDNSQETKDVIRTCTKRLTAIAKAKAPQSGMATPSKQSTK